MIRSAYNQPSPLITLTSGLGGGIVLGSVAGTVAITITPAQTFLLPVLVPAGFSPKNGPPTQIYVSDLDITNASGTVIRYVNFVITVYATVTK